MIHLSWKEAPFYTLIDSLMMFAAIDSVRLFLDMCFSWVYWFLCLFILLIVLVWIWTFFLFFFSFSKSQYNFLGDFFFFFFLFSDFFSLLSLSLSLSLCLSHFPIGWCHWLFAFYFLFYIISFSLDFIQFYYFILFFQSWFVLF